MSQIKYPFGIDGEILNRAYERVAAEENRILSMGGFVSGKERNYKKKKKKFLFKIIDLIAIVGFLLSIILLFFLENKQWCYWGIITSLAILIFHISFILDDYLTNKDFYVRPIDGKAPDKNELGTWNFAGITLKGNFRYVGKTYVSYEFFYCIVPIIPLACYRVTNNGSYDTGYKETTTFYQILGSEKWSGLELLQIYLFDYSIMILIGCIIGLLIMLF